jgi:hypothetical protein
MLFQSTRNVDGRTYTFQEAILAGWAADGALYSDWLLPNRLGVYPSHS